MEKTLKIPLYNGSEPFAEWRKQAEKIAQVKISIQDLDKPDKLALLEHNVVLEIILAFKEPALTKVEAMDEMKPQTWTEKIKALTEEERKTTKGYIKTLMDALQDKFRLNNTTEMRMKMEKWPLVPRSQVYSEVEEAKATLPEQEVWRALMSALSAQLKDKIATSLKMEELTIGKVVELLKDHDENLAKIHNDRTEPVPLSQDIAVYYSTLKETLPQENIIGAIASSRNEARSSASTRGIFPRSNGKGKKQFFCHRCRSKGHEWSRCYFNSESTNYRPNYVKTSKEGRKPNYGQRKSMFFVHQDQSDSENSPDSQSGSDHDIDRPLSKPFFHLMTTCH